MMEKSKERAPLNLGDQLKAKTRVQGEPLMDLRKVLPPPRQPDVSLIAHAIRARHQPLRPLPVLRRQIRRG